MKLTDDLVWLRKPQAVWLRSQMYRGEAPPHEFSYGGCEVVAYYGAAKNWRVLYLNLVHRSDDGFGNWTEDQHSYHGERVNYDQNAKLSAAEKARRKVVLLHWSERMPEQYTPVELPVIEVPKRPGFWRRMFLGGR